MVYGISSLTAVNLQGTVGQNNQEYRLKYLATRSSVRSHLFPLFWPTVHTNYDHLYDDCTMVENSQEYRQKYWATRSSVRSFARTAHSLARSLTSLTPSLVGK